MLLSHYQNFDDLASYPLWDGKWEAAKARWCAVAGGQRQDD